MIADLPIEVFTLTPNFSLSRLRKMLAIIAASLFAMSCGQTRSAQCSPDTANSHIKDARMQLLHMLHERGSSNSALTDGTISLEPKRMLGARMVDLSYLETTQGPENSGGFTIWFMLKDTRWEFAVGYYTDCSTKFAWGTLK
jgi:hypothetical protein